MILLLAAAAWAAGPASLTADGDVRVRIGGAAPAATCPAVAGKPAKPPTLPAGDAARIEGPAWTGCEVTLDGASLGSIALHGGAVLTTGPDGALPALQTLTSDGTGAVTVRVPGAGRPLAIRAAGSAAITVEDLGARAVAVQLAGAASVTLRGPGGDGASLKAEAAGAGRLDAAGWPAEGAELAFAEESSATTAARGAVTATAGGSAQIDVTGTLAVQPSTSDSGAVTWTGPAAGWRDLALAADAEVVLSADVPGGTVATTCAKGGAVTVASDRETLRITGEKAEGCTVVVAASAVARLTVSAGSVRAGEAVATTALALVETSGSGTVELRRVEAADLTLALAGEGGVSIADLAVGRLTATVAGSGDLVAAGHAAAADLKLTGEGDVEAEGLAVDQGTFALTGTGDATVAVAAGTASVTGDGAVLTVAGSGRVRGRAKGGGAIRQGR